MFTSPAFCNQLCVKMDAFGFVILVAIAAIFFVIFLMERVGQLRQKLNLPVRKYARNLSMY